MSYSTFNTQRLGVCAAPWQAVACGVDCLDLALGRSDRSGTWHNRLVARLRVVAHLAYSRVRKRAQRQDVGNARARRVGKTD